MSVLLQCRNQMNMSKGLKCNAHWNAFIGMGKLRAIRMKERERERNCSICQYLGGEKKQVFLKRRITSFRSLPEVNLVTPSGLSIVHAIHLFIFLFKEWSHLLFSICICPLQREGCVGKGWIDRLGQITNVLNPGLQLLRPAELRSISFQNGLSH